MQELLLEAEKMVLDERAADVFCIGEPDDDDVNSDASDTEGVDDEAFNDMIFYKGSSSITKQIWLLP